MSGAGSASESTEDASSIRVMVADDEESVVDVLRALIGSDPTLRFVGSANDAEEAIELASRERPDVVLLDVRMPGGGGLRAAREIAKRCGSTKVVALSAHEDSDTVIGMISAGASAYVPKGDSTERILRTIHRAIDASYVPEPRSRPQLTVISPMLPRRTQQSTAVARAILDGAITAEFEPIADLATGRVVGVDARPRAATLPHRSYDTWLADAQAADLLVDLEVAAFRASVSALPLLPEDLFLEYEVTPSTAHEGRFRRAIRRPVASRIVLGFSPLVPAEDELAAEPGGILSSLRERGVRIAARDVGPGFIGIRHLASLSPELARLDPTLVRPLGGSSSSHPIVAALVACAAEQGTRLIAPGVESEEQLHELANLGVDLVQGPIVGEPIPLSELGDDRGMWDGSWVKRRGSAADEERRKVLRTSNPTPEGGAS